MTLLTRGLLALALAIPSYAQDAGSLAPGARVRLSFLDDAGSPQRISGTLAAIRDGRLEISEGPSIAIASVTELEVGKGQSRCWRQGAVVGALVGVLVGFGGCSATPTICVSPTGDGPCLPQSSDTDGVCLAGVTLVHTALGAAGGLLFKKERWGEISLTALGRASGREPALSAALRISWR